MWDYIHDEQRSREPEKWEAFERGELDYYDVGLLPYDDYLFLMAGEDPDYYHCLWEAAHFPELR